MTWRQWGSHFGGKEGVGRRGRERSSGRGVGQRWQDTEIADFGDDLPITTCELDDTQKKQNKTKQKKTKKQNKQILLLFWGLDGNGQEKKKKKRRKEEKKKRRKKKRRRKEERRTRKKKKGSPRYSEASNPCGKRP